MNLQIVEHFGPRFVLAVERLREGFAFDFRGVTFCLESKKPKACLDVLSRSRFGTDQVTKQSALTDLEMGKDALLELKRNSSKIRELTKNHPVKYVLIYDYGTGSVELCHLTGDTLIWAKGMERFIS